MQDVGGERPIGERVEFNGAPENILMLRGV